MAQPMRRTISLVVEAAIVVGVVAYFVVEGISGNVVLTVALAIVGLTSLGLFVGVLMEQKGQGQ